MTRSKNLNVPLVVLRNSGRSRLRHLRQLLDGCVVRTPALLWCGLIAEQSKKSELCSVYSENGQLPPRSDIRSLKRPFVCHALRVFANTLPARNRDLECKVMEHMNLPEEM